MSSDNQTSEIHKGFLDVAHQCAVLLWPTFIKNGWLLLLLFSWGFLTFAAVSPFRGVFIYLFCKPSLLYQFSKIEVIFTIGAIYLVIVYPLFLLSSLITQRVYAIITRQPMTMMNSFNVVENYYWKLSSAFLLMSLGLSIASILTGYVSICIIGLMMFRIPILYAIILAVGLMLSMLIIILWFWMRRILFLPIVIIENTGIIDAFKKSYCLMRRNVWLLFKVLCIVPLLVISVSLAIVLLFTVISGTPVLLYIWSGIAIVLGFLWYNIVPVVFLHEIKQQQNQDTR